MGLFEYIKQLIQDAIERNNTGSVSKGETKGVCGGAVYDAVKEKADNTTASVGLPGAYDTYSKNFPTKNIVSGSVQNCLTYINDIADKLYTAINNHATALASKAGNTDVKGTYDKYTYSTSTHTFSDIAIAEPDKTAVYMAGDINDKLVNAINDHATFLANIPTKTVVVNHRAIDVGDEFNISLPLSYKFLIIELTIIGTNELCYGSIVSTDFSNGSVLSIVANGHGLSYWCDLSRMANTITVDGNFSSDHGELTITAF